MSKENNIDMKTYKYYYTTLLILLKRIKQRDKDI